VDADSGLNSQVIYEIVSGNEDSAFHLDGTTGVLTVSAGDGALLRRGGGGGRRHRLVVMARDCGTPSLRTVADLVIAVNDSTVVVPAPRLLDAEVSG